MQHTTPPKIALILISLVLTGGILSACTDATKAQLGAFGDSARVVCFSGGTKIVDDFSTGKVSNNSQSDGFHYNSITTNRLIEVQGTCVLDYGAKQPAEWVALLP